MRSWHRPLSSCMCVVLAMACAGTLAVLSGCATRPPAGAMADPDLEMRDLFNGVRIPKVVAANDGTILAFADSGRLLRRSLDQGETWSAAAQVGEDAGGNVMVDRSTGDILIVRAGKGYLWRSQDQGQTWAREKIEILPNALGHGTPDGTPMTTNCSEAGITLQHGEHAGRLLMPARIMAPYGSNDLEWWPYHYNMAIYSDDHGKTWQTSYPVQTGTGEGTLAELSDGAIYYNSRSHMSVDHRRRIAWSYDGGHMYVDWRVSEDLREVGEPFYFKYGTKPSYGCNAGLVRLPLAATGGKDVMLFSTPDNPGGSRVRMTVWASFDRGETWPVKRLVYEGPSAYSSMTADEEGNVYLLFERGKKKLYESVALARFDLKWLAEGHDLEALLASQ